MEQGPNCCPILRILCLRNECFLKIIWKLDVLYELVLYLGEKIML